MLKPVCKKGRLQVGHEQSNGIINDLSSAMECQIMILTDTHSHEYMGKFRNIAQKLFQQAESNFGLLLFISFISILARQ